MFAPSLDLSLALSIMSALTPCAAWSITMVMKSFTTKENGSGNGTYNGHDYVDLSLPSGTLWAVCNVGATTPEEYGDYFAWGETQPKDIYDWSTYQYCMGSDNTMTKYCSNSSYGYNGFTDNLTNLLPGDDAATANWGEGWRVPTPAEFQELLDFTTVIWTTQNGVNGQLFTSNNGNSLFLPAAGYRLNSSLDGEGSCGYFMSSSLVADDPYHAWSLYLNSDFMFLSSYNDRNCGYSVRPVHSSSQNYFGIIAVASPVWGGEVRGGGTYEKGQTCTLTATANSCYTFVNWTENDEVVSTDVTYAFTVNANRTIMANFVAVGGASTGAIDGKFTINADGGKVYFSQGNLQYQASTNTWRFAENQWDIVGDDNVNISETYNGWIDLFGWGTSGYNHGANCFQPWSTSTSYSDYYAYGDCQYNLNDQTGQADWGYNPISNGGNTANQWRTLSGSEWDYVFHTRTTTSGIRFAKANVNNVNGVILLPDNWSASTYSLSSPNNGGASFSSNTLSASQWSTMEQAGAVFLPVTGVRTETAIDGGVNDGFYWAASNFWLETIGSNKRYAYIVLFSGSYLYSLTGLDRYYGMSVRLVAPSED